MENKLGIIDIEELKKIEYKITNFKHKLINELDVYDFVDRMNISTGIKDICEILKEYISLFVGCENKKIK